ncbi:MAG: crossover junction endodeoxyribonuclease RuvC [Clostridia bacterium]|nr:crossover junction endodeoxyribonuclease RuvC [Clostridia bacterium]
MRILGIDPGYATIGYGVVDYEKGRFAVIGCGAITTPAGIPFPRRLQDIEDDLQRILEKYRPEALSIEKLYFNTNTTTAIDVAQARGVILLTAHKNGLSISEYTPLQVKTAVTGYGRAEKRQVMEMVKCLLGLGAIPKPDDAADALALAICHAYAAGTRRAALNREEKS